eukprot:CAMPEP_0195071316 /NCGR_PEP_ID=MMETSP0448-20130528/15167_1 /TAXON_ID=66468 /ORGANISM="Heterocapsa triquestra, Strain CCMP 448" /LENGTH=38 /DNA_ID= /DNA_START= /DNA_END= /DNA_ORIENTATION=
MAQRAWAKDVYPISQPALGGGHTPKTGISSSTLVSAGL